MNENISERLVTALNLSSKSQTEIASEAGITSAYLSDLKHGKRGNPSKDKISLVAEALGVSVSWLYAGEGPMKPDAKRDASLARGVERAEKIFEASEKRREELESLIGARLLELMEAGPARSAAILDECDAALRSYAKWIIAYRDDIEAAKRGQSHGPALSCE